ncbi:hypothetical protein CGLAU_03135 [Corynebacterium glaucum]|uniref:DUF418 domain-containing protein n=1 Tax=Corynebacterium glaucum TaxID=187491 RepID=A0A1Q2HUV6_9CORY|nr:DUF418 domain-containing protein [Corynebacterium glaucum]AQQ14611.1 hypothetical protein CGLAU_03135 [Corynebacterium glaucum]
MIVPDLARGLALAGIAMANATQAWMYNGFDDPDVPGSSLGGLREGSATDQFAAVFSALFVHVRGLPMFSTLLGFGIGLIAASLFRKQYPLRDARRVIVRRYGFLALFGLIHMFGLFFGDIMFFYGLIGMLLATMFTLSNTSLRMIAYGVLSLFTLLGTVLAVAVYFFELPIDEALRPSNPELTNIIDYFSANAFAGLFTLIAAPVSVIQLGSLAIIGYIWAREGYLVNVDAHRGMLWRWVIFGSVVAVGTGLPWGLSAIGVINPFTEPAWAVLSQSWGLFTGPAILAAIALATNRIQEQMHANGGIAPAWTYPFVALGKRSMSGYLAQSFLFIAIAMPFGLGVGLEASISGKLLTGLGIWLITLLLATVMEKAGIPGPFEQVHRRLSYGKTGRLEPYELPKSQ